MASRMRAKLLHYWDTLKNNTTLNFTGLIVGLSRSSMTSSYDWVNHHLDLLKPILHPPDGADDIDADRLAEVVDDNVNALGGGVHIATHTRPSLKRSSRISPYKALKYPDLYRDTSFGFCGLISERRRREIDS